ncbi:hypothetical protein L2E82_30594 [Cichorium intybus]|uniref:Uncharacterized protein n=1 Tax=Cichorium intybus TaxID=13427 RepID=A0ACB9D1I2_CICIN|nr:hypothetical protein L2E82_30594 [Cichorium intybus]
MTLRWWRWWRHQCCWTAFAHCMDGFATLEESRVGIVGGPFVLVVRKRDSKMKRVVVVGLSWGGGCIVVEFDRIVVVVVDLVAVWLLCNGIINDLLHWDLVTHGGHNGGGVDLLGGCWWSSSYGR